MTDDSPLDLSRCQPPASSSPSQAPQSPSARAERCRRDMLEVRLGLNELLVAHVIIAQSFECNAAVAWIPSLAFFTLQTGLAKEEVSRAISALESFQVIEWQEAPQPRFPYARRYTFFPKDLRTWAIAPRVRNVRQQEKAAQMDRWLRRLNSAGGPEQAELFPQLWDFADTLAEWSREQGENRASPARSEPATPDARAGQKAMPPAKVGTAAQPLRSSASPPPKGLGPPTVEESSTPTVGKSSTVPHVVHDWTEFNGEYLPSGSIQSLNDAGTVEDSSTVRETGDDECQSSLRPPEWPSWTEENKLLRALHETIASFIGAEKAAEKMESYGRIWRWRIRRYPGCVRYALAKTAADRREVKDVGGYLNREWKKAQRKQHARQLAASATEQKET